MGIGVVIGVVGLATGDKLSVTVGDDAPTALLVGDLLSVTLLLTVNPFFFLFFFLSHSIFCLFLDGFRSKLVGRFRLASEGGRLLPKSSLSS